MPIRSPRTFLSATVLALAAASSGAFLPGTAMAQSDQASLDRGARPDTTPAQRYQTAIREAGGGLKVALQECREGDAGARKSCEADARARYKADMAAAREMLRNPDAGPVNVVGEPIRSTETTTVIKP
ncbi:hypothetical protein [Acidovorax sp. SUPP3334]|uniref:hypothetical protein n=1 Tax=Acidovorax sp. SUPP3334 TaxID=2920881 RepID=UPI0023DE4FDF|nr:hypothetical protein [Acidovorax sp. SUPP3334]GKT25184.1 hypothetical protein AVHM3334_17175 [Acidovorax sp. SUPP3334]